MKVDSTYNCISCYKSYSKVELTFQFDILGKFCFTMSLHTLCITIISFFIAVLGIWFACGYMDIPTTLICIFIINLEFNMHCKIFKGWKQPLGTTFEKRWDKDLIPGPRREGKKLYQLLQIPVHCLPCETFIDGMHKLILVRSSISLAAPCSTWLVIFAS